MSQARQFHTRGGLKGVKSYPKSEATDGVTRYTKNDRYIDIDSKGKIIPFGTTAPW